MTIARIGTRAECLAALRMASTEGVWSGSRVIFGRLIGKPRWRRAGRDWHVEQEFDHTETLDCLSEQEFVRARP